MAVERQGSDCEREGSGEAPPCCREAGGGPYRATVLAAAVMLSVANHSIHGYELLEKVGSLVGNMVAVDKGSVYRLLRSFERQGLLSSEWELQSSGPHRRVYRLTPGGAHCLQAISAGLKLRAECLHDLAREADDQLTRLLSERPVEFASRATSGGSTVDAGVVGNDG